jgi:phosphatidylinositol-3-phosphatase
MRCGNLPRGISFALATAILLLPTQLTFASEKGLPQPDHVVVVIFENHSFDQIIDSTDAQFINMLARDGALFINAYGIAHPSQPNYFALFSGSTQGVHDYRRHTFDTPTLTSALAAANKSFVGFVETESKLFGFIQTGSSYDHNPWESFINARASERNFNEFPNDFAQLPTVSFVIPSLAHSMHDGSVRDGDAWLKTHLGAYAQWAKAHNSLLIITFDEDDKKAGNHIATIFYGAHVQPGHYAEPITHYSVLSTLLAMYGLPSLGEAAASQPIYAIWDE